MANASHHHNLPPHAQRYLTLLDDRDFDGVPPLAYLAWWKLARGSHYGGLRRGVRAGPPTYSRSGRTPLPQSQPHSRDERRPVTRDGLPK